MFFFWRADRSGKPAHDAGPWIQLVCLKHPGKRRKEGSGLARRCGKQEALWSLYCRFWVDFFDKGGIITQIAGLGLQPTFPNFLGIPKLIAKQPFPGVAWSEAEHVVSVACD